MRLALPALATFVRPGVHKSCAPGFHHLLIVWIFLGAVRILTPLFDTSIDGKTAGRDVNKVFFDWVVAGFPSVEDLVAEEAGDAVMIR